MLTGIKTMSLLLSPCGFTASFPSISCNRTAGKGISPSLPAASRLSSNWMSNSDSAVTESNAVASPNDVRKPGNNTDDVLVQYVVLRRDLIDTWPLGSVVTQGCHASVSAIWSHKDDPHTIQYCSPENIDSMHKVMVTIFKIAICELIPLRLCEEAMRMKDYYSFYLFIYSFFFFLPFVDICRFRSR